MKVLVKVQVGYYRINARVVIIISSAAVSGAAKGKHATLPTEPSANYSAVTQLRVSVRKSHAKDRAFLKTTVPQQKVHGALPPASITISQASEGPNVSGPSFQGVR